MSAARSRRANDKHNHLQRTPILVMGCSLLNQDIIKRLSAATKPFPKAMTTNVPKTSV